ncbi:nuclear transport factor 2 family protein [Labrys okinawensis]|uniref:nuclear transport factor 2 family protein n=1 Tax=Labrys okinawensis TaxID=346911 RepID=UPI0039BD3BBE
MALDLPKAIELYFTIENSDDATVIPRCFAPDAVVHDEGRDITGLQAIAEWKASSKAKYQHSIEPLRVSYKNDRTVVVGKVTGNFPGSPVDLEFSFGLTDGLISRLEIH